MNRRNCKKIEPLLYLFDDGLLEPEKAEEVRTHCEGCERCSALLSDIRKTGEFLKPEIEPVIVLAPEEIDTIVRSVFSERGIREQVIVRWTLRSFEKGLLAVAAVLVAAITLWFTIHRLGPQFHADHLSLASANDSIVDIAKGCRILVRHRSEVAFDKVTPTVVKLTLRSGNLLIKAQKEIYDTIAVYCGPVTVLATGTIFEVIREAEGGSVAVARGSVRVYTAEGHSADITVFKQCKFRDKDTVIRSRELPHETLQRIIQGFSLLSSEKGISEFENDSVISQPELKHRPVEKTSPESDTAAALRNYAIIRSMMVKGRYRYALNVLQEHVVKYPFDREQVYQDLGICFFKAGQIDSAITFFESAKQVAATEEQKETAEHRINKLIFLKGDFRDALKRIRGFLVRYPDSRWRESEYFYLIKTAIKLGDLPTASRTAASALKEYPRSCIIEEIAQEIELHAHLYGRDSMVASRDPQPSRR